MKIKGKMLLAVTIVFIAFAASARLAYGSSTVEPDLKIGTEDISLDPVSPVHVGTSVDINATTHNLGICYVVLGTSLSENLSNPDQIAFSFNIPTNIAVKGIKARIRSSNESWLVKAKIWIDQPSIFGGATSSSATWSEKFAGLDILLSSAQSHSLVVLYEVGGSNADLQIDWIQLLDLANATLLTFEAETYTGGGDTVDAIHPQNVVVQFFRGLGGPQIGTDKIVGDAQNTIQDGTVKYLSKDGIATASVTWTAGPPKYWDIYAKVLPDPNEQVLDNNQASIQIGVYAILAINVDPVERGTTDPLPGSHYYYGGTAVVSASVQPANPRWAFKWWVLDDAYDRALSSPTVSVTMDQDHTLTAWFWIPVGGYGFTIDKFDLLAPAVIASSLLLFVSVTAIVYARRKK